LSPTLTIDGRFCASRCEKDFVGGAMGDPSKTNDEFRSERANSTKILNLGFCAAKTYIQGRNGHNVPAGNSGGSAGSSTKPSVPSSPAKSPEVLLGSGNASSSAPGPLPSFTGSRYASFG